VLAGSAVGDEKWISGQNTGVEPSGLRERDPGVGRSVQVGRGTGRLAFGAVLEGNPRGVGVPVLMGGNERGVTFVDVGLGGGAAGIAGAQPTRVKVRQIEMTRDGDRATDSLYGRRARRCDAPAGSQQCPGCVIRF
jgi:hypothetical protein